MGRRERLRSQVLPTLPSQGALVPRELAVSASSSTCQRKMTSDSMLSGGHSPKRRAEGSVQSPQDPEIGDTCSAPAQTPPYCPQEEACCQEARRRSRVCQAACSAYEGSQGTQA